MTPLEKYKRRRERDLHGVSGSAAPQWGKHRAIQNRVLVLIPTR